MIIKAAVESNIGKKRQKNEDNFFFINTIKEADIDIDLKKTGSIKPFISDKALFAVFDGMGGEKCGEVASHTAATELLFFNNKNQFLNNAGSDVLQSYFDSANSCVYEKSSELTDGVMGTTAAVLYLTDGAALIGNIGDSRIYLFRNKTLKQISVDHCRKKSDGSKSSVLTQFLGVDQNEYLIEPFIDSFAVNSDDIFLLCSDGLTDMLTDDEISSIIIKNKSPARCVRSLISEALNYGGKDNVTALVCRIIKE